MASKSTPTSKLFSLQLRNVRLRKAISEMSRRQEVLEEFMDLEKRAELKMFMFNRNRMMYALGYTLEDILLPYGERSPKSSELVRLMRIVKNYQRPMSEKPQKRRQDLVHIPELKHLGIFINRNTGKIQRNLSQKCKLCHDPQHGRRRCPYKTAESRTPEVKTMIQERVEQMKEYELNDPFITNGYKKRNFSAAVMKAAKALGWRRLDEERTAIMKGMEASSGQPCSNSAAARIWNSMKMKASGGKAHDNEDDDDEEEMEDSD